MLSNSSLSFCNLGLSELDKTCLIVGIFDKLFLSCAKSRALQLPHEILPTILSKSYTVFKHSSMSFLKI